jgi:hypothetical protein
VARATSSGAIIQQRQFSKLGRTGAFPSVRHQAARTTAKSKVDVSNFQTGVPRPQDGEEAGFGSAVFAYRQVCSERDPRYTTVRLPEPEGRKIIAIGWATYPSLRSWTWPGLGGKELQVEDYFGVRAGAVVPQRQADRGRANRA